MSAGFSQDPRERDARLKVAPWADLSQAYMTPRSSDLDSLLGACFDSRLVLPLESGGHGRSAPEHPSPEDLSALRPISSFVDTRTGALRAKAAEEVSQLLAGDPQDLCDKQYQAPVLLAAGLPTSVKLSFNRSPTVLIPFIALQLPAGREINGHSQISSHCGGNTPSPTPAQIELGTYFPQAGVYKLAEMPPSSSIDSASTTPRSHLVSALRWMTLMERIHHLSPEAEQQVTRHIFSGTPPPWKLAQIGPEAIEDVWHRSPPCLEAALEVCGAHAAMISLEELYSSIHQGTVPYTERLRRGIFLQEQTELAARVLAPWVADAHQILGKRSWIGLHAHSVKAARASFPSVEQAVTTVSVGMARLGTLDGGSTTPLQQLHTLTNALVGEVSGLRSTALVQSMRALTAATDAVQGNLQSATQSLHTLTLLQVRPSTDLRQLLLATTETLVTLDRSLVAAAEGTRSIYRAIAQEADVESTADQAFTITSLARSILRATRRIVNETMPGVLLSPAGARCERYFSPTA